MTVVEYLGMSLGASESKSSTYHRLSQWLPGFEDFKEGEELPPVQRVDDFARTLWYMICFQRAVDLCGGCDVHELEPTALICPFGSGKTLVATRIMTDGLHDPEVQKRVRSRFCEVRSGELEGAWRKNDRQALACFPPFHVFSSCFHRISKRNTHTCSTWEASWFVSEPSHWQPIRTICAPERQSDHASSS